MKRWLFQETDGVSLALGDLETLIPVEQQAACAAVIPEGWRFINASTDGKGAGFVPSRFINPDAQLPITHLFEVMLGDLVIAAIKDKETSIPETLFPEGILAETIPEGESLAVLLHKMIAGDCLATTPWHTYTADSARHQFEVEVLGEKPKTELEASIAWLRRVVEYRTFPVLEAPITPDTLQHYVEHVLTEYYPVPSFGYAPLLRQFQPSVMATYLAMHLIDRVCCPLVSDNTMKSFDHTIGLPSLEAEPGIYRSLCRFIPSKQLDTWAAGMGGTAQSYILYRMFNLVALHAISALAALATAGLVWYQSSPAAIMLRLGIVRKQEQIRKDCVQLAGAYSDEIAHLVSDPTGFTTFVADWLRTSVDSRGGSTEDVIAAFAEDVACDADTSQETHSKFFKQAEDSLCNKFTAILIRDMEIAQSRGNMLMGDLMPDTLAVMRWLFGDEVLAEQCCCLFTDSRTVDYELLAPASLWAGRDSVEHLAEQMSLETGDAANG